MSQITKNNSFLFPEQGKTALLVRKPPIKVEKQQNNPSFFDLGTPNLRTLWRIETVAITTALVWEWASEGEKLPRKEPQNARISFILTIAGIPYFDDIITHKFKEVGEKSEESSKTFLLELYHPLLVPGGQQFGLTIEAELETPIAPGEEKSSVVILFGREKVANSISVVSSLDQMYLPRYSRPVAVT